MAIWRHKINLSVAWKAFENNEISFDELKANTSRILKDYSKHIKEDDLREELEDIAEEMSDTEDINEFDAVMVSLYDWGDQTVERRFGEIGFARTPKLAWIKTHF